MARDDFDRLTQIPLFAAFEPAALRTLALAAETRLFRAGDTLFRRGEAADGGYVLTTGALALETHDDGRPAEKILRPLTLVGEIALIAPTLRPATAIAREPTTTLKITRAQFHATLERDPATATRVRDLMRARLAAFADALRFDPAG
jgi:CRP-like cAMP-binding protein